MASPLRLSDLDLVRIVQVHADLDLVQIGQVQTGLDLAQIGQVQTDLYKRDGKDGECLVVTSVEKPHP